MKLFFTFTILSLSTLRAVSSEDATSYRALRKREGVLHTHEEQDINQRNLQSLGCGGKRGDRRPGKVSCPELDAPVDGHDPNSPFGVRCCSDRRFDFSKMRDECPGVWAGSRGGPDMECNKHATLAEAEAHCAVHGPDVRLCTCDEISRQCAKSTGCNLNKELVWCVA